MAPREIDPAPEALLALVEDAEGDEVAEETADAEGDEVAEETADEEPAVELLDGAADEAELESDSVSSPMKQVMSSFLIVVTGSRVCNVRPTQSSISALVVLQYS